MPFLEIGLFLAWFLWRNCRGTNGEIADQFHCISSAVIKEEHRYMQRKL
ncbi:MAG TPA: hypothetical protein PLW33_01800 [Candidatus Cloacimonas sp.]|nr:hypothetical protein [Candidatus Cloacimonas sp.]